MHEDRGRRRAPRKEVEMKKPGKLARGTGYLVAALSLTALVVATTRGAGWPPTGKGGAAASSVRGRTLLAQAAADPTGCSTDSALCFGGGRFLVEASWKSPDGATGAAHAVALTPDTGYFWFF